MSGLVQPSFIIIGAGAAGISAAVKLISNGLTSVTILEAENRIGGRIYSVPFGGTRVDLGAQWIHGEKGNVVYDMVKDTELVAYPQSATYHHLNYLTSSGEKLDHNVTKYLDDIAWEIFEDAQAAAKHGGSLKNYFEKEYKRKVLEKLNQCPSVAYLVRDWYEKFHLCLDPADRFEDIAAATLYQYKEGDGERLIHWKTFGYSYMFPVLMAKTPDLITKVKLNKTVEQILWGRAKPLVRCTDGSVYEADHVIVTVSLGVLKHRTNLFEPSLPLYKLNCIENMSFGSCQKIMLKFAKAWWPSHVKDFSFVWTPEDRQRFLEEIPEELGPALKNCSISWSWILDIFGFYTVDSHPDILLGWLVGPLNKEVELLPVDVVTEASMYLLRRFAGRYFEIPYPEEVLRTTWGTNPNFLGTYSYIGMETERAKVQKKDLVTPLCFFRGKPAVQFAGEATHDKFFSTVHGAVESGYREADRLIQLYGKREYHKVIIIGAGMAGLGAATKLLENGIKDVVILEAEIEPGGRIKTIFEDGKPLDLGAQWMHGKDNPLYQLAKQHDLLSEEVSEEGLGLYVRSNGDIVDPSLVKLISFKFGQILEQCSKLTEAEKPTLDLGKYLEKHFNQVMWGEYVHIKQKQIVCELFDWHVRFQVVDNSCIDLSRLSTKRWGDYVCEDDEAHSNFKYGYQSLVDVIVQSFRRQCSIRCNNEVIQIGTDLQNGIVLKTKNGVLLTCDHLILTPSLGVLKTSALFKEVLPEKILTSIENMGFAGICKIFLFYDRKWWGDAKGFQLLFCSGFNLPCEATWLKGITGFDQVFNHENALMTWVGGRAVKIVEVLEPELIARQCTDVLQFFLKRLLPLPIKVIRTRWLSNSFYQGSYCHITPECDAPDSGIAVLKEPVLIKGVPRVVLAGEAVHQSHYSTTHGAFESGLDQAQIICDFINSQSNK